MTPQAALKKHSSRKVADQTRKFFKTGKGEYSEGDVFIGVRMADIRKVAKAYTHLKRASIKKLVRSKIHEERMVGLVILVYQFEKAGEADQDKIYQFYVSHFKFVNNWDLVDVTAPGIIGAYLLNRDREELYRWARSSHLWTRRISIVAQWRLIREGDLKDVYRISKTLLQDEHDLIHKAVGWMLREAAKKDLKKTETFLQKHYHKMPRTMLRYAIERFPETKRQRYLKGKI